jgi:hypothetical protein
MTVRERKNTKREVLKEANSPPNCTGKNNRFAITMLLLLKNFIEND